MKFSFYLFRLSVCSRKKMELNCVKFIRGIAAVTLYCAFFVFPTLTESLLVGVLASEMVTNLVVFISSILILLLSFYGGFILIYEINKEQGSSCSPVCCRLWASVAYDLSSVLGASHIIYALPTWVLCNLICTWVWISTLPVVITVTSHLAPFAYIPGMFIGMAYVKSRENREGNPLLVKP